MLKSGYFSKLQQNAFIYYVLSTKIAYVIVNLSVLTGVTPNDT